MPTPVAWLIDVQGNPQLGFYGLRQPPRPLAKLVRPLYKNEEIRLKGKDSISVLIPFNQSRRTYVGPALLRVMDKTVSVRVGEEPLVKAAPASHFDVLQSWLSHPYNPRAGLALANQGLQVTEPLHRSVLLSRQPVFRLEGEIPEDAQLILYGPDGKRFWVEQIEERAQFGFPPAANFAWGQRLTWEIRKKTGGKILKGEFTIGSEALVTHLLEEKPALSAKTPRDELLIYAIQLDKVGAFLQADEIWTFLGMTADRSRWPYPPLPQLPVNSNSFPNPSVGQVQKP